MVERIRERWRDERSGWWRASVVLLGIALVLVVALAVTGVVLSTSYRPGTGDAWPALRPGRALDHVLRVQLAGADDGTAGLRTGHRVLSTLLFWTGFGLLVSGLGLAVQRHRAGGGRRSVLLTGGLPVLALTAVILATFTGYLIAWDQLALSAVTVGSNADGIWAAAFDDGIRFVLVDGAEVSQSTFARCAIAHVVLVPLLILGIGLAIGRHLARRPSTPAVIEPEPAAQVPELV